MLKNSNAYEGVLLAAVFASRGYIVVAPNYAGYDTGYSQAGYVAMAAHKAMQTVGMKVTAAATIIQRANCRRAFCSAAHPRLTNSQPRPLRPHR
jgi:hypothetical protein